MRPRHIAILVVGLIGLFGIVGIAWYQSLPRLNGWTTYSVEYVLTKNGNHTQIQASYNNGAVTTEQVYWLNFDNRTAVYNYFRCTPSMRGCTADGCPFTILNDSMTEYRVKIVCKP